MIETPLQEVDLSTMVIHANWVDGALHLWCESKSVDGLDSSLVEVVQKSEESALPIHGLASRPSAIPMGVVGEPSTISLRLPAVAGEPMHSSVLSRAIGHDTDDEAAAVLVEFVVPAVRVPTIDVPRVLEALADPGEFESDRAARYLVGPGVSYFVAASRLASHLISGHRVVPMILQDAQGNLTGAWYPWLSDEKTARRVNTLIRSMPAAARASADEHAHDAWSMTTEFLSHLTDAVCRTTMIDEDMHDTIEDADPESDPQVAWLEGLLDETEEVPSVPGQRADIARKVRRWISELEDRGESSDWRFGLRIAEPIADGLPENIEKPDETVLWSLSFYLQSIDDDATVDQHGRAVAHAK
ncbi:MAG: hypothetical protein ACWA5W_09745 [Phycisphaerales bacterium]